MKQPWLRWALAISFGLGLLLGLRTPPPSARTEEGPRHREQPSPLMARIARGLASKTPARESESASSSPGGFRARILRNRDPFRNAEILSEESSLADRDGIMTRKRVLKTDFKYPLVLLEEKLAIDPATGEQQVVSRSAMVADHILVKLQNGFDQASLRALLDPYGAYIRAAVPGSDIFLVGFDGQDVHRFPRILRQLQNEGAVAVAEPDYLIRAN